MTSSPRSPRIGDDTTLASFESLCQSIRNNLQHFPTTTLGNTVRRALDGITQHYNQSQDVIHNLERKLRDLRNNATSTIQHHQNTNYNLNQRLIQEIERANKATLDNGALWRTNANIRDAWCMCEEDYRSEKLMHTFWRVYYAKNYYLKFSLSNFFAISIKIKPNRALFYMGNTINGKIGRELSTLNIASGSLERS